MPTWEGNLVSHWNKREGRLETLLPQDHPVLPGEKVKKKTPKLVDLQVKEAPQGIQGEGEGTHPISIILEPTFRSLKVS